MAFVHAFPSNGFAPTRARKAPKKLGLFRSLLNAMIVARQNQAEQKIAEYLERTGGKFTDEAEREIERLHMTRANW
jgi:hypothetical protein